MIEKLLARAATALCLAGVGIAGYLTYVHYAGLHPICGISHGCETVQSSSYARLAGIPVALLGLITYVLILLSLRIRARNRRRFTRPGPWRSPARDRFAELAVDQDPRRALRLIAASAALRERGGGRAPAWLRRKTDATRAQAERLLSPGDAQRAWDEGAAMTTEETIAYALGEPVPGGEEAPAARGRWDTTAAMH
jgi:hypothetical protein